jgi:hypothetical protein
VDKNLIFGVARWVKTAGVLPLRFAPEKSAFCPTAVIMGLNQRFLRQNECCIRASKSEVNTHDMP